MADPEVLTIEAFSPAKAELTKLATEASALTLTDHKDANQVALIHAKRVELKKARVAITNKGKEMRESAVKFQRDVIAKEKELVDIISPEEDRLQALEDSVAEKLEHERRLGLLNDKLARLAPLVDVLPTEVNGQPLETFLLGLTDEGWAVYYNNRVQDKNERDRIANEKAQQKIEADRLENERKAKELDDEKKRLAQEAEDKKKREEKEAQDKKDAEALAEKQRLQKIEDDKALAEKQRLQKIEDDKAEAARIEKAKQDERERIAREAKEAEDKKKADDEALRKKNIFKKFMADNGYTEENANDYHIVNDNNVIKLYKIVGTLDLN